MSEQLTAPSGPDGPAPLGRRERAKLDKHRRLFDAAAALFAEHGYQAVTTQQIAAAADVATGTLFRYFPTKADLLVEVMNDQIRGGIDEAIMASHAGADPVDSVVALITPIADAGARQPDNIAAYLRETLFGPPNLRQVAVAQGKAIPDAIEQILRRYAGQHAVRPDVDLRDIADAIYAMVWFEGIKVITQGRHIDTENARHIVKFLINGLLHPHPASP